MTELTGLTVVTGLSGLSRLSGLSGQTGLLWMDRAVCTDSLLGLLGWFELSVLTKLSGLTRLKGLISLSCHTCLTKFDLVLTFFDNF